MSEDWEDVEKEINQPRGADGYYKPNKMGVGESEEIVVVSHTKWTDTKYPIKDKEGESLGYCWRFRLESGQVWDVSNANRRTLLTGLHPNGSKETVPGRFKVTNLGVSKNKQPAVTVAYLGVAKEEAGA